MANSASTSLPTGTPSTRTVKPDHISLDFGAFVRNKLINGNFDIWQRGTSFSTPSSGAYTADRWCVVYDGTIGSFTLSRQAFTVGQTSVPNEPTYHLRWNHTSAGSGSAYRRIEQRIEGVRTMAGKTAQVSFYAKADDARNMDVNMVQNFGSGGSADVTIAAQTIALTTSWQLFTLSFTVPSISGKTIGAGNYLALRLALPLNVTMTIDLAQAQVEEGNSYTSFENRPIGYEMELAQRYYQVVPTAVGTANVSIPMRTTMRASPTITGGGAGFATTNLTANGGSCLQSSADSVDLLLASEL